jgi:hypothetical protein
MYPHDLLYYYNKKYGYDIDPSILWRFSSKWMNTLFTTGKWRKSYLRAQELPKLGKPFVDREGEEDPTWDFDEFITEAHKYFQQHPEEQPSTHWETE